MKKRTGFLEYDRKDAGKEPAKERVKHYKEFYIPQADGEIEKQASRCMDCGIAFCNNACPLGNLLPDITIWFQKDNGKERLKFFIVQTIFPNLPEGYVLLYAKLLVY